MPPDDRLKPVLAQMRRAVAPRSEPADELYHWLTYQLGWSDLEGNPEDARRGKGIRPWLCLVACEAVGGEASQAVPAAAAIELTHEFSLVHDDIEDQDRLRRGRATLWALVGEAQAINAGDALFSLARQQLSGAEWPPAIALEALRRYDAACLRLAEGQHMDLAFEGRDSVAEADYVAMVRRKTGALLGAASGMGAVCGGAAQRVCDALSDYGEALGVAFQMADDSLGLWGAQERTGKPTGRDLERRKKTFPVVLALADPVLGEELAALLRGPEPDPASARRMTERLREAGYRQRTLEAAHQWSERALTKLRGLDLASPATNQLTDLVQRVVERDR